MYIARASTLPPLLCLSVRPLQLLVKRQQVLVMRLREQPSSKSRSSRMVLRPLLRDSATYTLNNVSLPPLPGGGARSTMTRGIVCP